MNAFDQFNILIGSDRGSYQGEFAGRPHLEEEIDVTVLLRRPRQLNPLALVFGRHFLSRSMLEFLFGADQKDIDLLFEFANHFRLSVVRTNKGSRTAVLRGTVEQMEKAFCVQLALKYKGGRIHRTRSGPISIADYSLAISSSGTL
jgi:kumamolisin